jgi:hypothetical protein
MVFTAASVSRVLAILFGVLTFRVTLRRRVFAE